MDLHRHPFDEGTITKLEIFEAYTKEWLPVFVMCPYQEHVNFSEDILKKIEERTGLSMQTTAEDKERCIGFTEASGSYGRNQCHLQNK